MIEVETDPLQKLAIAAFGPSMIPITPFEPMFFLPLAREVRRAVSSALVYVGGATGLADLETARAEGFEMVAMGRALIRDPALIAKYESGRATTSTCVPCNACITEMDRPGGVCCAKEAWQLERRKDEVRRKLHLAVCGAGADDLDAGARQAGDWPSG